jgi:DNA-binding CsgD family transcriptional regulator
LAISRANEADILVSLHRGARDDAPWSSFLQVLRRQTGAESVSLIVQTRLGPNDPDNAKTRAYWSLAADGADLAKAMFKGDPSDQLGLQRLRADRVYALTELSDPTDDAKTALTARLASRYHAKFLRIMRVSPQPGTDAWVVLARAANDLTASASALLSSLAPHLSVAVLNHLDSQLAKRRMAMTTKANQRMGLGWVMFSPEGNVIDACDAACALIEGAGLAAPIIGSRLVVQSAALTKKLGDAFARLGSGNLVEALVLSAEPRLELLLSYADQSGQFLAFDGAIVGYVRGADAPLYTAEKVLEALYGLAASEAKFALLLGQAKDIATASSLLGLTIETGRNYSKKIYAKTGVSGQAELIFLMANSVAALCTR